MKAKFFFCILLCLLATGLFYTSCKKNNEIHPPVVTTDTLKLTPYTMVYPPRFPAMEIPDDNKPFVERIALGRKLYYDPILSNDGRACASCHNQSIGFTLPDMKYNMPVLSHINLGWHSNFMWDGSKQGTLEDIMQFETKDFFATDLVKMNNSSEYKTLFKKYYGVDVISYKEIGYALAQFMRTLMSGNSKYDKFLDGYVQLNALEMEGWQIFFTEKGDCFHCHTRIETTDNILHNTGLDSVYSKPADKGYYNVTNNPNDLGKFVTPNLRNVALRSHFMHDGRFSSLADVINFYDHGMHKVNNLDPIMTKPGKVNGLQLNEREKAALIAFLNTLTDTTFINNPEFSNPE